MELAGHVLQACNYPRAPVDSSRSLTQSDHARESRQRFGHLLGVGSIRQVSQQALETDEMI